MEEYTVRVYRDGDEHAINDLFNTIFREKRSLEEWQWKFRGVPMGKVNLITVAESGGRILGQYANLPCLYKYQDKISLVGFPVDNFVSPEFRGGMKGIQKEMFEYQHEVTRINKVSFGFGFPNREAYIVGKRILKYRDIGKIRVLFKRLNWALAVKAKMPWLPSPVLGLVRFFSSMAFRLAIRLKGQDNLKGVTLRETDPRDEDFDLLWEKVKGQAGIIGVRDRKYVRWRFTRPGHHYTLSVAEKEGEMAGYLVTGIKEQDGMRIGYIVDLLSLNSGVTSALISEALCGFTAKGVDFVLVWMCSHSDAFTVLTRFGFSERDEFPPVNLVYFIFDPGEADEAYVSDLKNWYLTMADSDAF
ncbi:MAG: GNAT family N-acetyltransferase [Nitrospirota bacterium]